MNKDNIESPDVSTLPRDIYKVKLSGGNGL